MHHTGILTHTCMHTHTHIHTHTHGRGDIHGHTHTQGGGGGGDTQTHTHTDTHTHMDTHTHTYTQVDEITRTINQISLHAEQIKHNHNVILASVQNSEARENTDELMNEVKKQSHRVHSGLKRKGLPPSGSYTYICTYGCGIIDTNLILFSSLK